MVAGPYGPILVNAPNLVILEQKLGLEVAQIQDQRMMGRHVLEALLTSLNVFPRNVQV